MREASLRSDSRVFRLRTPSVALVAAAAAVLVYGASLAGTFQYDDKPTIVDNPAVRDPGLVGRYFTDPSLFSGIPGNRMYRPVLLLTYLADHRIAGYSPFVWHLTNVLLHGLNAALVVLLAAGLARTLGTDRHRPWFPLLAGLVFALHPVNSEVVNYISARSDAIATAGLLGAFLLHLSWTRGGGGPAKRGVRLLLAAALLLVGLGGKEIAIAFLPVVLLYEILAPSEETRRRRIRNSFVRAAPYLAAAVLYFGVRHLLLDHSMGQLAWRLVHQAPGADPYTGGGRTPWQNLLTQSRVFWRYAWLFVLPVNLAVDRFVRVSTSFTEPAVLASTLAIAGLVVLLATQWRKRPLLVLAGGIVFFGLAPTSSVLPLNIVMNEHRLYLPSVGVALLAGWAAEGVILARPRAAGWSIPLVLLCWAWLSVGRSLEWRDPRTLWEASLRVSPDSYRNHNQLGAIAYEEATALGSGPAAVPLLDDAIAEFEEAVRLYPDWYDPHLNLGMAFRERARITGSDEEFERSVREFTRCTELVADAWRARYQIATTYGVWKKYDEAIRRFAEMAGEDRQADTGRRFSLYLFPMAKLERERGRPHEAAEIYREILGSSPADLAAHLGLAQALMEAGRPEEAAGHLKELVSEHPADPDVRLVLAQYLLSLDPPDRKAAAAQFQKALALGYHPAPGDFERYLGS